MPAVNLIGEWDDYDGGIHMLTWLPQTRQYGAWDSDHYSLTPFPAGTTWADIEADPERYLGAQWDATWPALVPWPGYPFKEGTPDWDTIR